MAKIPLLDWDASAEEVLNEFPMLRGATKSELSLMKTMAEDEDAMEEDVAMVRAIEILERRNLEGDYNYPDDDDLGGAKVGDKVPV